MNNIHEASIAMQKILGIDDPITRDISVIRDIKVPMRDGVLLSADYWAPCSGGAGLPVALVRSPYKHKGGIEDILVKPLVERGFQAVLCSIRGMEGSEGEYTALGNERNDGLDTIEWIIKQPWFGKSIIMLGPSYQGNVQWALAGELPPQVKMLIPSESSTKMAHTFLNKKPFALESNLGWGFFMNFQKEDDPVASWMEVYDKAHEALWTLPPSEADTTALGHHFHVVQKILHTDAGPEYSVGIDSIKVPMSIIGGWYDVFLTESLEDFEKMQNAGCQVYITIGDWLHYAPEMTVLPVQEAIKYGLPVALGEKMPERPRVRLYIMGAEEWQDYDQWPPAGCEMTRLYLHHADRLSSYEPEGSEPDRYRYDPADPTPSVGGSHMMDFPNVKAGRAEQKELEERSDVLVYTGEPLEKDTVIIGTSYAEIWFCSDLKYADVFVKVCDVDAEGNSFHVCNGIVSLENANETQCIKIALNPTAYEFKAGHRIRVQVSSGAFPEFARNMGTGAPVAAAIEMQVANQTVYHDAEHPSCVILPVKGDL